MKASLLKSHWFERNGCVIHYWIAGPEQRPLIIFIHGIGIDHSMFDAQVESLSAFYRVIVWDLRGHGQSRPKGQPFSVETAAEDLLALCQHTGYTKATLVGVSMGGNIALMAAALAPDLVASLVLVGSGNQWLALPLWSRICLPLMVLYVRLLPAMLFQRIFSFLASTHSEVRHYVYRTWCRMNKRDFIEVWDAFSAIYQKSHPQPFRCPPCPLLLISGQYDISANYRHQWKLWEYAAKHCRHATIPKAGHLASNDNPTLFNELLIKHMHQFIEGID